MEFFDSHSHFNDEKFNEDREEIIKLMYKENITKTVCVGYNVEQSKKAIEISKNTDFIYATTGISPNDIEDFNKLNLHIIEKMTSDNKVVAIGEIGLDYYWNKDNKDEQKKLFIEQIEIANKINKPIIIKIAPKF